MSTCTGLAALDHADTKFSIGYAATGIGACIDGRHEFMLPNGVGDLQKGERYDPASKYMFEELRTQYRYVNMDYLFASSM